MTNYYDILKIKSNASQNEIKRAYRKLAKKYHPDNYKGTEEEAEEFMSRINEAYDTLVDEKKRKLYDAEFLKNSIPHPSAARPKPDPFRYNTSHSSQEWTDDFGFSPEDEYQSGKTKRTMKRTFYRPLTYSAFLIILIFLAVQFNLPGRVIDVLNINRDTTAKTAKGCINCYFKAVREHNAEDANSFFLTSDYDKLNDGVIAILSIGDGSEDLMYQPLYEEFSNFEVSINDVTYNEDETEATVTTTIQNINCYTLFIELNRQQPVSSINPAKRTNYIIRHILEDDRDEYLTETTCTFTLIKRNGLWEINKIEKITDLVSIFVGNVNKIADKLIQSD